MNILEFKILAIFAVSAVPLLAGGIPFILKKKNNIYAFSKGEAFSCGVFLGAGLLHMLVNALSHAANSGVKLDKVMLFAGMSFLTMLLLEHISIYFANHKQSSMPYLATMILSLHSISAGVVLGMADSYESIMLVLLAILSHKWAAGFSLAIVLIKHISRRAWPIYLIFVSMTPLGIILGQNIMPLNNEAMGIYVNAIAAGTFLYIGTLHGLKQAVLIECCDLKTFIWVLIGFSIMAIIH